MSWRRIGIYYGLAVLFGGYFLAFLWDPVGEGPITEPYAPAQSRFLPFSRESINELQLLREGLVITCQYDGERWQVVDPPGAAATSSLVTSLIENLTLEKETRIVKEQADDLTAYGLQPPHATIVLKGKTETDLAKILIGGRNPTSTAVYASKEGSSQVVLLGYNARYYEELLYEAVTGSTAGTNGTPAQASAQDTASIPDTAPAAESLAEPLPETAVPQTTQDSQAQEVQAAAVPDDASSLLEPTPADAPAEPQETHQAASTSAEPGTQQQTQTTGEP